jgi:uncharacterized protein (DUF58 family)
MTARARGWLAWFTPPRSTRPTRDGWWCLGAAVALGFAAMNTGNNLLYLLASLLLGLIVVSGVLSEQSMRRLRLAPLVPDEIHAGRPAVVGARVANRKRWRTSYSLTLEAPGADAGRRRWIPRLPAGAEREVTWEVTLPARGRHRLPGVRVCTRFPFGLFVKTGRLLLDEPVVVFPALRPVAPHHRALLAAPGPVAVRRRGRGHELHSLRDYRTGDDPRLIHWRSSARAGALVVRELEAETTTDTRLVLEDRGGDPARRERGISEAASLAAHLCRAGGAVELVGPGTAVPLGRGRAHLRRLLTALALYGDPAAAEPVAALPPPRAGLREVRIPLG